MEMIFSLISLECTSKVYMDMDIETEEIKMIETDSMEIIFSLIYNPGKKYGQTALYLTPQAMYNQFKRPSAGSVRELYYIHRKTKD